MYQAIRICLNIGRFLSVNTESFHGLVRFVSAVVVLASLGLHLPIQMETAHPIQDATLPHGKTHKHDIYIIIYIYIDSKVLSDPVQSSGPPHIEKLDSLGARAAVRASDALSR